MVDYSACGGNFHTCGREQVDDPLSKNIPKTAKIQLDGGYNLVPRGFLFSKGKALGTKIR